MHYHVYNIYYLANIKISPAIIIMYIPVGGIKIIDKFI